MLWSIYIYSLVLWVGSIFFLLSTCIPTTFKAFKEPEAFKFIDLILPRYFNVSFLFGIAALISFYILTKNVLGIISTINISLLLLANAINLINGLFIFPKASKKRIAAIEAFYKTGELNLPTSCKISAALNTAVFITCLLITGITSTLTRI